MHRHAAAALLAVAAFVLFNANGREIGSYDSQPAKFLAIELATRQSFSLGHVVGRLPLLGERAAFAVDRRGNYRSAYPLPSAIAAGGVAWILSFTHAVDLGAPLAPSLVAKLTASLFAALTVALAFLTGLRRTSAANAALVAIALACGTNMWASVSQTLWQQETALLGLMGGVLLLSAPSGSPRRALAVGVLLGLAGCARPQLAPAVAVLALSLVMRWGRGAALGIVPIALAASAAIAVNVAWFGHPLGAVPMLESLHGEHHAVAGSFQAAPWISAAGLLVSPSRGLLIFSPIAGFALFGLGRARRETWRSDLRWCAAAALAQFVFYCFYSVWWAGHTFGPRYTLDLLPPLVPLAAAAMPVIARRAAWRLAAAVCLIWSMAVAATGAFVYPADVWNVDPLDVDRNHERLWDWRDSQIRRCWQSGWSPQNFALFSARAFRRDAPPP